MSAPGDPGHGPPVVVITGQLSAGKSTVARALLDHFPLGLHVDVDAIREMVTAGLASPLEWTEETARQFDLALTAAAALAGVYQPAGYAVAIEGGVDPPAVQRAVAGAGLADHLVGVVLRPRLEIALARNAARTTKAFDTAVLEPVMRRIDADLAVCAVPAGWTVIDNSDELPAATVNRILAIRRD